jgi:dTDP-4-amino-4,6-dideoxygalactose transaminase
MTTTTEPAASGLPPVPVEDVTRWHAAIAPELRAAFEACLPGSRFTLGPQLRAFEAEFAAYCGAAAGIGISSGTAALALALRALGIGPGDEVITVPNTYVATVFAITYVGALPVFVDVDPVTANIDPARVAAALTPATKAILPVHLFGLMADMPAIMEIARARGLAVIEDACQSHGAAIGDRRAGAFGTGTFSFYPTKNMTTAEGGMITTSDPAVDDACRIIRQHGMRRRYHHDILGFNFRTTDVHAAIGLAQLKKLGEFNAARRANAAHLNANLRGVQVPVVREGYTHVYHQYTVRVPDGRRDALRQHLQEHGIGSEVYYPIPLHQQTVYRRLGYDLSLPEAERAALEVLSLPVHPALTEADLAAVVAAVNGFMAS